MANTMVISPDVWAQEFIQKLENIRKLKIFVSENAAVSLSEYILDPSVHNPFLPEDVAMKDLENHKEEHRQRAEKANKAAKKKGEKPTEDPENPPVLLLAHYLKTKKDMMFTVVGNKNSNPLSFWDLDTKLKGTAKIYRFMLKSEPEKKPEKDKVKEEFTGPHLRVLDFSRYAEQLTLPPEQKELLHNYCTGKISGNLLIVATENNTGYVCPLQ